MDLNQAILFGQLVNAAYQIDPADLRNRAGQIINAGTGAASTTFEVITSIYANDLATDINKLRAQNQVSIGLVLQASASGEAVVAIRGTEGILEWIHDASFGTVNCPFPGGAGKTEDGFTEMYNSLVTGTEAGAPVLAGKLASLPWKGAVNSLTICGHSLGGALATLLAFDVAVNTKFKNPTAYTYASPRTGDPEFANAYNRAVPNTFRIANRLDVVPNLPLPPLYEHVLGEFPLNPVILGIPPKPLVRLEVPCLHFLSSYLFLLARLAGAPLPPLDPRCNP